MEIKQVRFTPSTKMHEWLKKKREETGLTITAYIRMLILAEMNLAEMRNEEKHADERKV